MSFANQPSRLLISSDDLSYGTGNSFTCVLPEPITGAVRADLLRAVIPNTGYQIPAYQSTFYYYHSSAPSVLQSFSINTNQYIDGIVNNSAVGLVAYNPLVTILTLAAAGQPGALVFTYNYNTQRIVGTATTGTWTPAPSSAWVLNTSTRAFSLNTRAGFNNANNGALTTANTANILPNLIRSKVIYVLCNVVMNDSISTDGLRTAIAKVPVNSSFSGLTFYQPPKLNWNRLVTQGSYQQITVQLLDDQYQPYPLTTDEFCEFEIVFQYDDFEDARGH
jgi:hypothetical protein